MTPRRLVWLLGASQLLCWGVSFYLVGVLGERIALDLGWSREVVYGGFSVGLLVMGLASPWVGAAIERHGGRAVMSTGSVGLALCCLILASAESLWVYLGGWALMGLAMRCTLYDAAFASTARILGAKASRPIAQITLLGGLASTVLWPIGNALAEAFGWRGALVAYAAIALSTLALHLAIPTTRAEDGGQARSREAPPPLADAPRDRRIAGGLYALSVMMAAFLNSAMSAHMIGLLTGLGLTLSVAVWASTLRGIGQTSARMVEVLFGARLHPITLNFGATFAMPVCFGVAYFSGAFPPAAIAFAFLYGASNGLQTITRGTLPLALFDPRVYGSLSGKLLAPSWILSAAAPLSYAFVIERFGAEGGLLLSQAVAALAFASAALLWLLYRPSRRAAAAE